MSEWNPGQESSPEEKVHAQAERQTAAGTTLQDQAPPSSAARAIDSIDSQKLLVLLKNPTASLKLQPATEWIYGAAGAAAGVVGFFVWMWFYRLALEREIEGFFGGLVSIPLSAVFGLMSPGKFLLIGLFSIVLLVGSLTVIGNWQGARKRTWMEAVTYQGGTQLLFGVGWVVAGVVAFVSFSLSMLIGIAFLLLSLIVLVAQAADLHEISGERKFSFTAMSVGAYMILLYLVYSIFD